MATRSCGENGLIPSVHNSRALSAVSLQQGVWGGDICHGDGGRGTCVHPGLWPLEAGHSKGTHTSPDYTQVLFTIIS